MMTRLRLENGESCGNGLAIMEVLVVILLIRVRLGLNFTIILDKIRVSYLGVSQA